VQVLRTVSNGADSCSDTIPFQWLTTEPQLCNNAKFIDVDYDDLMASKRDIVLNTPELRDLFDVGLYETQHRSVLFNSDQYTIIGCDLKNVKTLKRAIKSLVEIDKCLVLCVAEVSLAYMATEDADAVLAWASTLSRGKSATS
jgi:tRNA wybutosine-synthesizing protein 4